MMRVAKIQFGALSCLAVLLNLSSLAHCTSSDVKRLNGDGIPIANGTCDLISCGNFTDGCIFLCQRVDLTNGLPKLPGNVTDVIIDSCHMPVVAKYPHGLLPLLRSIEITYSNVRTVSNDAFSIMSNLETVIITGNLLKSIPPNIFWLPLLKHVDLSNNLIKDISFPDNITVRGRDISINLSNNTITGILKGTFYEFTYFDAVSLFLARNYITNISRHTFDGIRRFNSLDLSGNNFRKGVSLWDVGESIQEIPTKELKLVNCKLNRHLDSSMFQMMSRSDIEMLDLSNNSWELWPRDTLKHLPYLKNLTINHCPYFAFFEAAKELENATYVSLSSNALLKTQIITEICKSSKKLEYLDVSSNHFQFETKFRSRVSSLKTFDFSNNNQKSNKAMRKVRYNEIMPNLETLKLRNINANWVNYMEVGDIVLTNMSKLGELDLSYNRIGINSSSIGSNFKGLNQLHKLNISYNNIAHVSLDTLNAFFHELPTLRIVDLSFNNIQRIPYNLFSRMSNLTILILEGNRLTSFSDKYMRNNLHLTELWLQRNALTWIDANIFTPLHLSILDIRQNAFYCSCDLVNFKRWLNTKSEAITVLGEDQSCKTPDIYEDTSINKFELPWLQCNNHLTIMVSAWIAAPVLLASIVAVIISYFRWDIKYWWILRRSRNSRKGYTELSGLGDNIFKYDGFVSYNSDNEEWVTEQLIPNMEHSDDDVNVKLCIAERDFTPGEFIADNIVNSINESRKLMFVITEEFIKSQWCAFELEMAHLRQFDEKKNLIVLIFLDKIPKKKLPRKIRLLMRHVTYVEWDEKNKRTQSLVWKKLKLSLLDNPIDLTYGVTP
ncbi:unnamed protein product [Owenia fusiformis]|uniref:TIR domain-containing protein n=1 Tax=Owenia fusiformis TaxID=6347 RepID=A0A8S4P901_OWEFU|nr:unnamed protein product [Owenia fusiformis]